MNAQNDQGYAPLHLAANEGNIDIHTINVWEFINIWKKKILLNVGNEVVAQLLLENGANVNIVINNGTTPLAIATANFKRGNLENVIFFLHRNCIKSHCR